MTENNIVNFGDLSKPVTVLIEKISDAVGGIFAPHHVVRMAKADAQAEKVRALAKIEISDIEQRALTRMVREEGIHQANIESITLKAIPYIKEEADTDQLDGDWLAYFFRESRLVTDAQMQELWAKILAGEVNSPSTFSKRTIMIAASLSRADAHQFTEFCSCVWHDVPDDGFQSIWRDVNEGEIGRPATPYTDVLHLASLGLITLTDSGLVVAQEGSDTLVKYYNVPVLLGLQPFVSQKHLGIGKAVLTQAGKEMFSICGSKPKYTTMMDTLTIWMKDGHPVSCPIDAKAAWQTVI